MSLVINAPTELDLIVDVPTFHPLFSRETASLAVPSPVLMAEGFLPTSVFAPEEFESTKTPRWSWFKSWTGERVLKFECISNYTIFYFLKQKVR